MSEKINIILMIKTNITYEDLNRNQRGSIIGDIIQSLRDNFPEYKFDFFAMTNDKMYMDNIKKNDRYNKLKTLLEKILDDTKE